MMQRLWNVLVCLVLLGCTGIQCKEFNVYWNIPTCTCQNNFNISFTDIVNDCGITMNDNDKFRGNQISILYKPGLIPEIYNYNHTTYVPEDYSKLFFVNGGIPQVANFTAHLDAFERVVNRKVPDTHNSGLIIIDIEEWGATWAQNFNNMEIYRIISRMRVQEKHPLLPTHEIEHIASLEYDRAALLFLVRTLQFGEVLRPKAKWGFYQYPQCFNRPGIDTCSDSTKNENDQMIQMWRRSDVLYPSLYLSKTGTVDDRAEQIRGKVREAKRVGEIFKDELLVLPYITSFYYNEEPLLEADMENLMKVTKEEGADGVVIWGAYADYNTEEKCVAFRDYVTNVIGPISKKYISLT